MLKVENVQFSYDHVPGFKPFKVRATLKNGIVDGDNIIFVRNIRELHKLTRLWNETSKTREYSIMRVL